MSYAFPSTIKPRHLLIVLSFITATICGARSFHNVNLDSALHVLDHDIDIRQTYYNAKEAQISALRQCLRHPIEDESNFNIVNRLYDAYRSYQSDSAFYYSQRLHEIADKSHDDTLKSMAHVAVFDYYISVWLLDEAFAEYNSVNPALLPEAEKISFYKNSLNLFFRLKENANGVDPVAEQEYSRQCNFYVAKTIEASRPGSFDHEFHSLKVDQSVRNPEEAIRRHFRLLSDYDFDAHEKALLYGSLASFANQNKDNRLEAFCYAMSAVHDIRSATRETASVYYLAKIMEQSGDSERAVRYMRTAFDDALTFNSRLKQQQTGMMLPMIESIHYNQIVGQRRIMMLLLTAISALFIISGWLLVKLFRRNKRLERMKASLDDTKHQLEESNCSLTSLNEELNETIALKDSYIMQSLYVNTDFLNQVEQRCREAINNMKTKGLEAMRFLPYQMGIKEERQRIMRRFDQSFLEVFPNFIEDFNLLLDKGQALPVADDGSLSTELRIFLGVTDIKAVADFLNIAPNSIYVYKARIKAKSPLSKKEFDEKVMQIRKRK